jgi:hypothetical protein
MADSTSGSPVEQDGKVTVVNTHSSKRMTKRTVSIAIAVILLCVIGGALYWRAHTSAQNAAARADNQAYADTQTTATTLSTDNRFDQAAALWISYALGTTNRVHKDAAYTNAAAMYLNNNQDGLAYTMCKKAEAANGVNYGEAEEAAAAAKGLGNTAAAIQYYKDAIRLIPASTSDAGAQKYVFNLDIQQLQARS